MYRSTPEILRFRPIPPLIFPLHTVPLSYITLDNIDIGLGLKKNPEILEDKTICYLISGSVMLIYLIAMD